MYNELKLTATTLNVFSAAKEAIGKGATSLDSDMYRNQAELAGVSGEELDKVETFRSDFVAGVTLAAGENAITQFTGNKELLVSTLEASMGKDTAKVSIARHKEGTVGFGPTKGEKWEKHCAPVVTIRNAASAKTSQLGRVFAHLQTSGANALGNK